MIKIVKNPGNGCLNNLNDPRPQCVKILIYHHPGRTENTTKYIKITGLCSDTKMWKPEHTVTMVIATVIIHSTCLFKLHCPKNAYVTAKVSVVSVPSHVLIHIYFCRPLFAINNT